MTPRLDTMLDLCKSATKGSWYSTDEEPGIVRDTEISKVVASIVRLPVEENAAFIASCDPQTIEAMIGLLKAANDLISGNKSGAAWSIDWLARFDEFNKEVGGDDSR